MGKGGSQAYNTLWEIGAKNKKKKEKEVTDRELWVGVLYQMAAPD